MGLRRNSSELRDGIVKFVLSDLACHTSTRAEVCFATKAAPPLRCAVSTGSSKPVGELLVSGKAATSKPYGVNAASLG
jgi:hypothetical protein